MRVLGPAIGGLVYVGDTLKGLLPVLLLPRVVNTTRPDLWAIAFGVAAIIGHVRPIFLMGKGGGKGVATATGVFLALAPVPTLVTNAVWIAAFYFTRYVSLASLLGAVVLPLAIFGWYRNPQSPVFIASVIIASFVFWTHRANIGRLRRGEEHRFVKKESAG
jgi:glycerol-3-phosphate acyltransferase PlsY